MNNLSHINLKIQEVIIPDAMIIFPIFTPARSKKDETVLIDELFGFKNIVIKGAHLNVGFHKKAYRHILKQYQNGLRKSGWKNSGNTTIVIDEREMFSTLKIKNTDFPHYRKQFESLLEKLYKYEVDYTSPSGVPFHGRLINTYSEAVDGVRTINLGDIFSDMLKSHSYASTVNYVDDSIKVGVASELMEKLDIELRKISNTDTATVVVKAEYLLQSLQLAGKREKNIEKITDALEYLKEDIGFISKFEKVRTNKVQSFKVTFNKNFNLKKFKSSVQQVIAEKEVSGEVVSVTETGSRKPLIFGNLKAIQHDESKHDISGFDEEDDELPF